MGHDAENPVARQRELACGNSIVRKSQMNHLQSLIDSRGVPRRGNFREPGRTCRFAGPVDPENPIGFGRYFWPMGDVDPRQRKLLQIPIDLRFLVEIEVSGAFVEEKYS